MRLGNGVLILEAPRVGRNSCVKAHSYKIRYLIAYSLEILIENERSRRSPAVKEGLFGVKSV